MKLAAGAASIPELLKYPHAAATMQPTSRPKMTPQDFMMGDPNRSMKMIVTNTVKPRPMNWALPHGAAIGASLLGQFMYGPLVGRDKQLPEPPAQSSKPDSIREIPISMTVGPVTRGGNTFLSTFAGANDKRTSSSAQHAAVPMMAPYP